MKRPAIQPSAEDLAEVAAWSDSAAECSLALRLEILRTFPLRRARASARALALSFGTLEPAV